MPSVPRRHRRTPRPARTAPQTAGTAEGACAHGHFLSGLDDERQQTARCWNSCRTGGRELADLGELITDRNGWSSPPEVEPVGQTLEELGPAAARCDYMTEGTEDD